MEHQRDRIVAVFERELAQSPVPPELRGRAVRGATSSRSEVAHPSQQWAVALVAVLIAIATVGTLIGFRALRSSTPTPVNHGPLVPLPHNGFIVMGGDNNVTSIGPVTGAMSTIWSVSGTDVISDVAYSPDGKRLAYLLGSKPDGGGQIWILDIATHHATQLTTCTCTRFSHLSWSPDGSRLAFADADLQYVANADQLFLIDSDGTHRTQLTHLPLGSDPIQPSWSPDGNLIAFKSQDNIDVIKPDGSGLAVLLTDWNGPSDPAWSPDGSKIAYVVDPPSSRAFDFQLWLMDPDGSHRTNIFVSPGCCVSAWGGPAWSPDGTQIAVVAYPGWHLWVMNADGGNQRNVGPVKAIDRPAWQPVP
jgi:dipeptidyl aminopeptidase/acylaminoacyl peptidase